MKSKLNQIIEVEWNDTVTHSVWIPQDEAKTKPLCRCKTVGYFLNEDEQAIRVSCTIQLEDKSERDLTIIPQGCITKIRKL